MELEFDFVSDNKVSISTTACYGCIYMPDDQPKKASQVRDYKCDQGKLVIPEMGNFNMEEINGNWILSEEGSSDNVTLYASSITSLSTIEKKQRIDKALNSVGYSDDFMKRESIFH